MTYTMRIGQAEPGHLAEAFADARLLEYKLIWADVDQHEGLAYRPGSSTRGVGFKWRQDEVLIQLQTLASPADWLIGIRLASVLAGLTAQALALVPEGRSIPADEIERRLDADWLAPRCHLGTELITELVLSQGESVTLQGWSDSFQIGPGLLAELAIGPDTDSEDAYVVLVRRMRSHQVLAADEALQRPTGMVLSSPDGETELCCAALPANQCLWLDTRFLAGLALWPPAWQAAGREPVWFPAARLPEHFGARIERLDEAQYLLKPLDEAVILRCAEALEALYTQPELPEDYQRLQDFFKAREAVQT